MRLIPLLLILGCPGPVLQDDDAGDDDTTATDDDTTAADDDSMSDDDTPDGDDDIDPTEPLPQFHFDTPAWTDENRDGIWEIGEVLFISLLMHNDWDTDHMAYPGAHIAAGSGIDFGDAPDWWFYGLFAGQSSEVLFSAVATAETPLGDQTFTVSATSLGCPETDCPAPNPFTFVVPINPVGL